MAAAAAAVVVVVVVVYSLVIVVAVVSAANMSLSKSAYLAACHAIHFWLAICQQQISKKYIYTYVRRNARASMNFSQIKTEDNFE